MNRTLSAVLLAFCFLPRPVGAQAGVPDPAALRREIEAAHLDPSRAVTLKNVKLNAGLARLTLEDGVLLPVTAVGGKTVELVFLGKGRIAIEPPDAVEAGQLDLFTGAPKLDEELTEMVLVLGLDAAVDAVLRKPRAEPLDPALARRGDEVYAKWKGSPERKLLNVDGAVLKDVAGDSSSQGFFAAWFKGTELGEFLYLVEPDSREQVTLGHFVPLEATEKRSARSCGN